MNAIHNNLRKKSTKVLYDFVYEVVIWHKLHRFVGTLFEDQLAIRIPGIYF